MADDWSDDELFEKLAEEGPGWVDSGEDFERLGRLREARLKLGLRAIVMVVSALLSGYLLNMAHPNLCYWLTRSGPVADLGDLRRDDGALDRARALHQTIRQPSDRQDFGRLQKPETNCEPTGSP